MSVVSQSNDFFKTMQILSEKSVSFYQTPEYLFILQSSTEGDDHFEMKIAPAFSDQLQPIDLAIKRKQDYSFTVLDTSESQIFLGINHKNKNSMMSNIYVSNFRGKEFVLTLQNAVRDVEGNIDFEKVASNFGCYIANVYDQKMVQQNKTKALNKSQKVKGIRLNEFKKTFVTFDKGGMWHLLKAPKDSNCSGECSLHLRGRTESIGNPIYSQKNAPGIVLGTGNTGFYLEERAAELNTYLSRDGGYEWEMIAAGSYAYEVADNGGIIVMAKDSESTKELSFSWDEGITWETVEFFSQPINVSSISTEPSNMELVFIIQGNIKNESADRFITVQVDFKFLHERTCTGSWSPGEGNSDYEVWSPHNYAGGKCVLGRSFSYLRRKRTAKCFNNLKENKILNEEFCECTEEDWECTFGTYHDPGMDECVPQNDQLREKFLQDMYKQSAPPADCKDYYKIKTHFQIVPMSFCTEGVQKGEQEFPCPGQIEQSMKDDLLDEMVMNGPIKPPGLPLNTPAHIRDEVNQQYEDYIKEQQQYQYGIGDKFDARNKRNQNEPYNKLYIIVIMIICIFGIKKYIARNNDSNQESAQDTSGKNEKSSLLQEDEEELP